MQRRKQQHCRCHHVTVFRSKVSAKLNTQLITPIVGASLIPCATPRFTSTCRSIQTVIINTSLPFTSITIKTLTLHFERPYYHNYARRRRPVLRNKAICWDNQEQEILDRPSKHKCKSFHYNSAMEPWASVDS